MEAKSSDWRPGPTVCRCCLTEGCYKDISTEYFWMGKREVYAEMLSETLNLSIAFSKSGGPNSNSRLICEPCISRLRDASEFKRQVIDCEKTFMHHLDPGSSSRSQEFTVDSIGEVKVEVVKREKRSISEDDFDDRPDFLDVDSDDDLDDQPLTKLASKIPKKESVDLLDLLDTSQITVKRKSNLKLKVPPKKIVKKKEVVMKPKPSASKAAPPKQAEKKKDDEWTTTDTSDTMNTHKTPSDEWITTDTDKGTVQIHIKLERQSSDTEEGFTQNDEEWITTDSIINPIKIEGPDFSSTQNSIASYRTPNTNDEWIVSDTNKQNPKHNKISNNNEKINTQAGMKLRAALKNERSMDIIKTSQTTDKPDHSQPLQDLDPASQISEDEMVWARIGHKWIKIVISDQKLMPTKRIALNSEDIRDQCSNYVENDVNEESSLQDNKKERIKKKITRSHGNVGKAERRGGRRSPRSKKHLDNARLILQHTTAIPIRIELSSVEVPCFACQGKFIDPFSFRDHFIAEHKDVDKTQGMHLYNNVQTRADITDLACLQCGQSFDTIDLVARHLCEEHEIAIDMDERLGLVPLKFSHPGQFICAVCQKKCMTFRHLYRHAGLHFHFHVCEICGKTFESTPALTGHRRQSHVDGSRCKVCKVVFSTVLELRQHIKNKKCRAVKCKICNKSFAYNQLLQKHRETAHGASKRVYQCLECPNVYEKRMMLYFHIKREHTDHYKCGSCGKTFSDSRHLKKHMPVHTGERPYKCQVCQQTFKSSSYHRIHVRKCKM